MQSNGGWLGGWLGWLAGVGLAGWLALAGQPEETPPPPPAPPPWLAQLLCLSNVNINRSSPKLSRYDSLHCSNYDFDSLWHMSVGSLQKLVVRVCKEVVLHGGPLFLIAGRNGGQRLWLGFSQETIASHAKSFPFSWW